MFRFISFFLLTISILPIFRCDRQNGEILANRAKNKLKYLETTKKIKRDEIPLYGNKKMIINEKEYDFIIIGGGSTGSILANRLSDPVTGWTVLVLEAGSSPESTTEVPLWANLNQFGEHNWKYEAERESTFGRGLKKGKMKLTNGKGLGGTSLINHMIYSRGHKNDYDSWNLPGWSYKDLLPYFKKLDNCNLHECNWKFRGNRGEIHVEFPKYKTSVAEAFLESALMANYTFVKDYNSPDIDLGGTVSYPQAIMVNGLRLSAEKAFLRPCVNRQRLTVYKESFVTKLIFDKDKRAIGVKFKTKKKIHTVYAHKEIILSAGAINTPQILMLSGIGPENHLKTMQIPILSDLPVGEKLTDHVSFWGIAFVTEEPLKSNEFLNEKLIRELYVNKTGLLNVLGCGTEVLVFGKNPDIEILFLRNHFSSHGGILKESLGISDKSNEKFNDLNNKIVYTALVTLLHPKSTGKIELKSRIPTENPKINMGYFTDQNSEDMKRLINGIREVRNILKIPPLSDFGKSYDVPFPPCAKYDFDSDFYWKCSIEHLSTSSHDYASTCSIGKVVDTNLKVKGVRRLRIGDLSVIPGQITGHPNALAYVIGEKLSDLIKNEYLRDEL